MNALARSEGYKWEVTPICQAFRVYCAAIGDTEYSVGAAPAALHAVTVWNGTVAKNHSWSDGIKICAPYRG